MHLLHHVEAGDPSGPLVVLLHGGGLSHRQWAPQLQRAAAEGGFHLLAPDLPEQGLSAAVRPFTLEGAADGVAELVRGALKGREGAHVAGISLGGAVGLTLLQRAPELVRSLFVSGTAAGFGKVLGGISMMSAGLYGLLPRAWLVKSAVKQFGVPPEHAEAFAEDMALSATADFTRSFTRALMGLTLPARAEVPLLVAVGERETQVAKSAARRMVRQIAGARGVLVPGAGHVWNLEAPDLYWDTLRAFVREEPLPERLSTLDG